MKKLYLLRHGQTEFNVKKLVQGRCDSPLTDLGRQQAAKAAAWLKARDVTPDKVVSSPLSRAMATARLVAGELLARTPPSSPAKASSNAAMAPLKGARTTHCLPTSGIRART